MSILDQLKKYSLWKREGLRVGSAKLPGAVENLCCEVYNAGGETLTLTNIHPDKAHGFFFGQPPSQWERIVIPPGEWGFLPHGMYDPSVPSGNKRYPVVLNVGDEMFRGNKLPSRPDGQKKMRFFT